MTIDLALEYIPRRMRELGYGNNYHLRFRHLLLQPLEKIELEAFTHLYLLVEEAMDIQIYSELGVFDLSLSTTNEMQYEHQGTIKVINQASDLRHVRFIQLIPGRKSPHHETT